MTRRDAGALARRTRLLSKPSAFSVLRACLQVLIHAMAFGTVAFVCVAPESALIIVPAILAVVLAWRSPPSEES